MFLTITLRSWIVLC